MTTPTFRVLFPQRKNDFVKEVALIKINNLEKRDMIMRLIFFQDFSNFFLRGTQPRLLPNADVCGFVRKFSDIVVGLIRDVY